LFFIPLLHGQPVILIAGAPAQAAFRVSHFQHSGPLRLIEQVSGFKITVVVEVLLHESVLPVVVMELYIDLTCFGGGFLHANDLIGLVVLPGQFSLQTKKAAQSDSHSKRPSWHVLLSKRLGGGLPAETKLLILSRRRIAEEISERRNPRPLAPYTYKTAHKQHQHIGVLLHAHWQGYSIEDLDHNL
jgi:hypothetical protein